MAQCKAITNSGSRCGNSAQDGSNFCHITSHQEQEGIIAPDWAKDLTDKQRRFVEEYCIDYNATQAAIRAGYSEKTAHNIGWENVRKREIKAAIESHMDELAMTSAETLKRFTDMGRGSLQPFLVWDEKNGSYKINLGTEEARKHLHLIKKLKQNDTIIQKGTDDKPEVIGRTFEIEIHDPKDALKQIGKVHGIYAPEEFKDVSDKPKQLVLVEKEDDDG